MKKYDIVVPKKDARDPNKTYWKNVGSMVKFDATAEKPEGFIIELHMFPTTDFKVFEQKPKADPAAAAAKASDDAWDAAIPSEPTHTPPPVVIDEDSIPF